MHIHLTQANYIVCKIEHDCLIEDSKDKVNRAVVAIEIVMWSYWTWLSNLDMGR